MVDRTSSIARSVHPRCMDSALNYIINCNGSVRYNSDEAVEPLVGSCT